MFLTKRQYSNKTYIIKGLFTAILLSAFIYLNYFQFDYKILNTLIGFIGIYFLLTIPKKSLFITGFFTGLLWFYWIAISLKYYDLFYLAPLLLIFIALFYGICFYLFAIIDKLIFRIFAIFIFTFLQPFGFNWFKLELIFINSYFDVKQEAFILILVSIYLLIKLKKHKFLFLIPLLFILNFEKGIYIDKPNSNIYMAQMNINQELKWQKSYQNVLFEKNFQEIYNAIDLKKDLVILPETAFTTPLNLDENILNILKELSYKIDIYTGALFVENGNFYNASYFISNAQVQIAKKVVLVPFGEEIPLPKFFVDIINEFFFNGASDYAKASSPTDFIIKNEKFRNAICYEATTDKIFENLDDTRYMIAISNNAWFTPSIQSNLQNMLLKYYSKKYNITIYHVVNGTKNKIFRP